MRRAADDVIARDVSRAAAESGLELILVRHAETTATRAGRYLGWSDAPLTVEGEASARGVRLKIEAGDLVFGSDSPRALRTAQLALPAIVPQPDARLRELNFGAFDGATYDENLANHGDAFRAWIADPRHVRPPGGELVTELESRIASWIASLPANGRVVAFAHAGSIRAAIAMLDRRRTEDLRGTRIEPCGIIRRMVSLPVQPHTGTCR